MLPKQLQQSQAPMWLSSMIASSVLFLCLAFSIASAQTQRAAQAIPIAQRFDLSPGKRVIISDSVFRKGSDRLESQSMSEFDQLARYIQARPDLEFEIRGHASNEGSPDRNLRLSIQRADATKEYLVRAYGISPARIKTSGVGDTEPLTANVDEKSRAKNRRVEFIGISSITQRRLTREDNKALESDGYLSVMQNKVEARAPWDDNWQTAYLKMPIYENHRINTYANSRAEVTFFNDNSKIQIGENASIIVYSPNKNRGKDKPQETVELVKGDLLLKMQGKGGENFLVKSGGKQVTVEQGTARIGLDSTGQKTAISVLEGQVDLRTSGSPASEGTRIKSGSGTILEGGLVGVLRKIPDPPKLMEPDTALMALIKMPTPLTFKWLNKNRTRIEIAEEESFLEPVLDVTTREDSVMAKLDPGVYFFRITSVDSVGLVSRPIIKSLTIAGSLKASLFKPLPFTLMFIAVLLAWFSVLFSTPFEERTLMGWGVNNRNLLFNFVTNPPPFFRWLSSIKLPDWFARFRSSPYLNVNHQMIVRGTRYTAIFLAVLAILILLKRETPVM